MAGFRSMLAFWAGGAASGAEAATTVAGGDYGVKTHGKGRKRRYFINLDGRRLYGNPADLERILDARAKPPLVARAVPSSSPQPAPAPVAPAAAPIPAPDLVPVDLEAYRLAKAKTEAMQKQMENAAIALLLMS